MKRLFWIVIFSLFSMAGFSQDIFEGISGLKFLSTDTLEIKNVFVWQGDTIRKDSIVYADINNDCIRFHYIDGNWTKWFCDSDIKKALNHVHNDQDTIKTNELITNVTFQNDTLKIIEQGFTWKVKIQNVETDPVFNSWNKDYNDLTNKPTLFSGDYNDLTNKPTITPGYNQSASYNKSTHIFSIIDANGSVSDTIPLATNVVDGLMSKEDKAKLDSDTDQSPENELNTNLIFDVETKELSITDAGGTRSVTIDINVGNAVNSYVGKIDVVSSTISVTWPDSFSTTNYFLRIDPYYVETIGGKSIRISNAVYDFVKTVSGFSLKLDTVAGFVEYFAADTTNIYPIEFGNYLSLSGGTMNNTNLVSNLNADLLDGLGGNQYTRSDTFGDSSLNFNDLTGYSGMSSINASTNTPFGSSWYTLYNNRHRGGIEDGNLFGSQIAIGMTNYLNRISFRAQDNGTWQQWNELWHTGNDGSGSGLDADLIDGQHGSYYTPTNDARLSDTRTPTNSTVSYSKVATDLASSGTVTSTVNLSERSIGYITLSASTAFTFTNYQLGKTYLLIVTANGFTPSFATAARHVFVTGNETLGTSGVFYISLTCINATPGSEKLLTTIMKEV